MLVWLGTSEVLPDSIITYSDEEFTVVTHNYWTDTPITPGTKYRLSVAPPNGPATEATTITPTATDPSVAPDSGNCRDQFAVIFQGVEDARRVRAWIEVKYLDAERDEKWISVKQKDVFTNEEGNVVLLFRPSLILAELAKKVHLPFPHLPESVSPWCWDSHRCLELDSDQLRIRYRYLGPEWYGNIPEDSLTYDPIRSHDVSNGLGFFGSLREDQTSVTVDTANFIWTGVCGDTLPGS